jgi:hypothetical protein
VGAGLVASFHADAALHQCGWLDTQQGVLEARSAHSKLTVVMGRRESLPGMSNVRTSGSGYGLHGGMSADGGMSGQRDLLDMPAYGATPGGLAMGNGPRDTVRIMMP